ncbi:hypothetical protein E4U54_004923 [Claviceps lovelessii]|nr:hypothetical protein E4U54_004923 [Claviceps lovelessii]
MRGVTAGPPTPKASPSGRARANTWNFSKPWAQVSVDVAFHGRSHWVVKIEVRLHQLNYFEPDRGGCSTTVQLRRHLES